MKVVQFIKITCPVCGIQADVALDSSSVKVQETMCFCGTKLEVNKDAGTVTIIEKDNEGE